MATYTGCSYSLCTKKTDMCTILHSVCGFLDFLIYPGLSALQTPFLFLVAAPEPTIQTETFKKKDIIEILSHKKAYNACKCNCNIHQSNFLEYLN